jgi:GNAT superfamily N-acetyltransferase
VNDYFEHAEMPDCMALRAAAEHHRARYAELTLETLGVYARNVFGLSDEAVITSSSDEFAPENSWVVEVDDVVVAIAVVEHKPEEVWLDHLVVTPRCQGLGIGTALVRSIQRWAEHRQLPVTLSVIDSNPAGELYVRLGFVVDRVVPPRTFYRWYAGRRHGAPSAT